MFTSATLIAKIIFMVSSENRRLDRLAVFSLPLPLHRPWLFFFARPELVEKQTEVIFGVETELQIFKI